MQSRHILAGIVVTLGRRRRNPVCGRAGHLRGKTGEPVRLLQELWAPPDPGSGPVRDRDHTDVPTYVSQACIRRSIRGFPFIVTPPV